MRRTIATRFSTTPKEEAIDWNRVLRIVAVAAFVVATVRAVAYFASIPNPDQSVGIDYRLYLGAAERWRATGVF
jgi:hypothetical protein